MLDPAKIPIGGGGELIEPPIIDSLTRDELRGEWAVSFVPEEKISSREKEQVTIPFDSIDGRRIDLQVKRLELLLTCASIERVFHAGEGSFSLQTRSGQMLELVESEGRVGLSTRAYVELADIAMTAQLEFLAACAMAK